MTEPRYVTDNHTYLPRLDEARYIVAGAFETDVVIYDAEFDSRTIKCTDCLWMVPNTEKAA
jgi:hypothetical protein